MGSSTSTWKIGVGHHPIRSYGEHCNGGQGDMDCRDMQFMKPLLQQHKVWMEIMT